MKRVAIILIPIFLLVSLALTVYIVVTQRMEMRKKAEEVTLSTAYGSSKKDANNRPLPITDWCDNGGPFVEVEVVGTSYNAQTGIQTLNLKAKRIEGPPISTDLCPTPTTQEAKVGVKAPTEEPNSTPTKATTPTLAPTATKAPADATKTTPSVSPTSASTLTPEVKGAASYKIPLCKKLDFTMLEQGCTHGSVNPNMCTSCDSSDPGYFSNQVTHTIPAGQVETSFSVGVKKPANQLNCGCSQIDLHIWDVNYPGSDNMAARRQIDCNTIKDDSGKHPSHDYLYGVGMAATNCASTPTISPTVTSGVKQPTDIPSVPTATPTTKVEETPTPNQTPLCSGLSATPNSGTTPLTVHFIGSGTDPDGPILKWEFNYGDGTPNQVIEKNIGNTGSVEIDHTYTKKGAFTASFRIQDNNGVWSNPIPECSVSINTTGTQTGGVKTSTPSATLKPTKAASASATPVAPNVPKSGNLLPTLTVGLGGLLIIALGLLFAL